MINGSVRAVAGTALAIAIAAPAAVGDIQAIYTNIDGDPTAQVPGLPAEQFRTPLAPFLALYGSPNGSWWVFKAFTDNNTRDVIVAGSGTVGSLVAAEFEPSPLGGLTYGFMDSDCGINDSGSAIFGNRLSGGATTEDEILFISPGGSVGAREGDSAPDLFDPGGSGDELFGNSLNSAHILNDGTPCFRADLIQNIDTNYESALYQGSTVVAQEGESPTVAGVDVYDSFVALSGDTFSSSADGSRWIVEADLLDGLGTDEGVVVTGTVVLRDGDVLSELPGSPVDAIFAVDMAGNGDWYARGDLLDNRQWAVRNGAVIAATGEPITDGATELYTTLLAVNGNSAGDYVVVGATDAGDQVAVLNGTQVLARTGDPVALGAGPSGPFLGSIDANDVILTDDLTDDGVDDRELYFFGGLADGGGADIGDVFAVVAVAQAAPCPWDCGDFNGVVSTADFNAMLIQWGMSGVSCDIDGGGVSTSDFNDLLIHWGPCP